MATEKEMQAALDQIEGIVAASSAEAFAMPTAQSLCAQYEKIKKHLEIALPLIEKFIPIYGSKIAGAIRFLMTIADTVCPAV